MCGYDHLSQNTVGNFLFLVKSGRQRMKPVVAVVLSISKIMIPLVFSLLLVIPHSLILAQVTYPETMCSNTTNDYTDGSQFESNLKRFFSGSLYKDGGDCISYWTTADDPDKVYGLFLCGVDVASDSVCKMCIDSASVEILKKCPFKKEAIIWFDRCLISYSNRPFVSATEMRPFCMSQEQNNGVTESDKFNDFLRSMFANLSIVATSNLSSCMNATTNVNFSGGSLDGKVQCTSNLSLMDCRNCLSDAVASISNCTRGSWVGRFTPSCIVGYQLNGIYGDPPVAAKAPSAIRIDKGSGGGRKVKTMIVTISISSLIVIALLGSCIYYQRRKIIEKGERFGNDYNCENFEREHTKSQDFPSIQLDLIHAATNYFSEENKLGEGGFGPVYKAWKLWSEGQGLELMDPLLVQSCVEAEVSKCIHIGLLCVQEDAADRPTMSSVVVMFRSDTTTLPRPTQPAFSVGRLVLKSTQSSPNVKSHSINEINLSDVSPR